MLLPAVQPYLIVKANRAAWAIEVLGIQEKYAGYGKRYPEEVEARLFEIRSLFDNDPNNHRAARNRKLQGRDVDGATPLKQGIAQ